MELIALCLDTNAFSARQRSEPLAIKLIAAVDQIWLPAVVLGELRGGFLNASKAAANELHLQDFLALPYLSVASVTEATSRHYAKISHQLRKDGKAIPSNDIWIAATAMGLDCPIFTYDKHFKHVKGLTVVSSETDWISTFPS